jgi:hypothetical protein
MVPSPRNFGFQGKVGFLGGDVFMPEADKAAIAEILKPVFELWANRTERKAVRQSGKLRFWKDGMLKQLKEFSKGKGSDETLKKLRAKYHDSNEEVSSTLVVMGNIRDRLGGGPVAQAIDEVLNEEDYGKGSIRKEIKSFIEMDMTASDRQFRAMHLCIRIGSLNACLDRLRRLVYE